MLPARNHSSRGSGAGVVVVVGCSRSRMVMGWTQFIVGFVTGALCGIYDQNQATSCPVYPQESQRPNLEDRGTSTHWTGPKMTPG